MTPRPAAPRGNLPAEISRFVGRRAELAEARRILGRGRLLTLTGPGGVGKTRLALRLAAELTEPDGAWLVELAALHDPALLPHAVAAALRLPGGDAAALTAHLASRGPLLVLDNAEHLLDACAELTGTLLRAAPALRVVVTSREPLNMPGEHVLPVGPLPVSGSEAGPDALALFADRAAAARPGFAMDDAGRRLAARLVRRLDGVPLAIELAAVRLRTMSLENLLAGLDDRFALLGLPRDRGGRHETMRAAVAWSHRLCGPDERLLWARLSVFAGSFDLAAAEAVCGEGLEVFDTLARLVDKSVVLAEQGEGGVRYRMLGTLRDYGAELLTEDLRPRHLAWFRGLATGLVDAHDDLRAALEYAVDTDPDTALDMAASLWMHWTSQGLLREGLHWLNRVLPPGGEPSLARARALGTRCLLALLQNEPAIARAQETELWEMAERLPDDVVLAHAHQAAGQIRFFTDDPAGALPHLEKAVKLHQGQDEALGLLCLLQLSAARTLTGDPDTGYEHAEECRRLCAEHGDEWLGSYAVWMRGFARYTWGDADGAAEDARACLAAKRRLGDRLGIVLSADLLAACALALGEPADAVRLLTVTEPLWRDLGDPCGLDLRGPALEAARAALGETEFAREAAAAAAVTLGDICGDRTAHPETLTRREQEVARLVASGLTNRAVAMRLGIAKRTVDAHIEHIFAKLGVNDRTRLADFLDDPDDDLLL
ncbi:ATP-binding protein [Actinomadura macrotermitis]|uniref:ATP-binding protein n=1 Tax=Actinomadura macrotermitis TaxID=2585200 RepID=UPI002E253035